MTSKESKSSELEKFSLNWSKQLCAAEMPGSIIQKKAKHCRKARPLMFLWHQMDDNTISKITTFLCAEEMRVWI